MTSPNTAVPPPCPHRELSATARSRLRAGGERQLAVAAHLAHDVLTREEHHRVGVGGALRLDEHAPPRLPRQRAGRRPEQRAWVLRRADGAAQSGAAQSGAARPGRSRRAEGSGGRTGDPLRSSARASVPNAALAHGAHPRSPSSGARAAAAGELSVVAPHHAAAARRAARCCIAAPSPRSPEAAFRPLGCGVPACRALGASYGADHWRGGS